jgi:hypothetical protein
MATKLSYDNLDLGLVRTMKVEQKAKYDPHNTDTLYIANRFTVETVLSTLPLTVPDGPLAGVIPPATIDDDRPADIMARIRRILLRPRRDFKYSQVDEAGETILLQVTADSEANNGPKPESCTVTQVADRTWKIEWEVEVAVQDCTAFQEFASNRFETTQDIDERGYSTITTMGRVFVRTDMKRSPDALRPVITPPVPKGFRRKSMYQVAEDGLSMAYKFTDSEFFLGPPKNAVLAKGRFSIVTVPPGAIMWAQVDVHLEGKKDQPKRQLMETAVLLALRRLEAADIVADPIRGKPFVEGGSLSEELWDNSVDVQLRGRIRTGSRLATPNDQFQASRGFWSGVFTGAAGVGGQVGAGQGAGPVGGAAAGIAAGASAGLASRAWNWAKGIISKDPTGVAATAAGVAAGASAGVAATVAQAGTMPAEDGKPPQVGGATIDADFIERFGAPLVGVDQHNSFVDPGLRGNIDFIALVAAAFRDPCVIEPLVNAIGQNPNLPWAEDPNGVGATPLPGDKGGRTIVAGEAAAGAVLIGGLGGSAQGSRGVLVSGGSITGPNSGSGHALEDAAYRAVNELFRSSELAALIRRYQNSPQPAFDWRAGRLTQLTTDPGFVGVGVIRQVPLLPTEPKPLPQADDFPGWYESYYCEVAHTTDHHQDVVPATVSGAAAIKCQWANPIRTIEIRWSMAKAGFPPELPVIAGDPNIVILTHRMELPTMEVAGDGQTPIWTTNGHTAYKAIAEDYVEVHYPVPPWLNLPMRFTPAPLPDTSLRITGGADGAAQDGVLAGGGGAAGNNGNGGVIGFVPRPGV